MDPVAPAAPAASASTDGAAKAPVVAPADTGAADTKVADGAAKPGEAAKPEAPAKPDPKPERISAKMEEIRKREQKVKELELKFTTSTAEHEKVKAELDAIKAAKGNPRKLLELGGFKDMTEFAQAMVKNPEAAQAATEVEKLRAEIAAKEKKATDEADKREQAEVRVKAVARVKGEIEKAGDAAEFVVAAGEAAVDDVVGVLESYWAQHGVLPDLQAAIKQVDAHYEAQWKRGAATKRGKAFLAPVVPDPKAAPKVEPEVKPKPSEQPLNRRRSERAELQAQLEESFNPKVAT